MNKHLHHSSIPHLLHIETTYRCNSNCIFCYNPNRNSEIDYDRLDKIVDSVRKAEIPHVYLIGGEPSMLSVEKLNEYIDVLSEVSSVTIVTNGIKYLKGLSKKLACIGIPIHGDEKTHEYLNNNPGSYKKIITSIKNYVSDGFDVRCIPVLMNVNYSQIYDIISLAKKLNMESVFVDRYEEGGIGSRSDICLKPTNEQFSIALGQMIKARDDFNIPVGWGTAIPYCLDERLLKENMYANCGVGSTFCAVNPKGDLRICNQSDIVYGNILEDSIENIWNKSTMNDFRSLEWVTEPCNECDLLHECVCGCKVDQRCSDKYCVDYAIRYKKKPIKVDNSMLKSNIIHTQHKTDTPMRTYTIDPYTKLNLSHKEKLLVTRYQTIEIDKETLELVKYIIENSSSEEEIVNYFSNIYDVDVIRNVMDTLIAADAIHSV